MTEFFLNPYQVEYIQAKMPLGYSFQQSQLLQPREQRVLKKPSKYDAYQYNQGNDDANKRVQRIPQPQKELKEPLSESARKGLSMLNKIKNNPTFIEIYAPVEKLGLFNTEKLESQFINKGGNLTYLTSELQNFFKQCHQVHQKSQQLIEKTHSLESNFNDIFKVTPNSSTKTKKSHQSKQDIPMNFVEKQQLGKYIRELNAEQLRGVWEIVQASVKADGDNEIEFDIEFLPAKVARKLEAYVLGQLQNKKVKTDNQQQINSQNGDSEYGSESSE